MKKLTIHFEDGWAIQSSFGVALDHIEQMDRVRNQKVPDASEAFYSEPLQGRPPGSNEQMPKIIYLAD